jgi:hypothetical protein
MNTVTDGKIDRVSEWGNAVNLMRQLWPKWDVTPEQIETWRQAFGDLNPEWVREALRRVYIRYSSESPKPSWLRAMFAEVQAGQTGTPVEQARDQREQEWIEYWEQSEMEARNDQARMRREIESWSKQERAEWLGHVANNYKFLVHGRGVSPDDTTLWSNLLVGFVHAARSVARGVDIDGAR